MNLLDPAALAKIGGLALRARVVVEGALSGLHRSPQQGQSVEFAEHKEYVPGDEIRHIDWKAMARVDRTYIKRFEQETNLRAYLCIDVSASMGYQGGAALSKLDYAKILAAALAHVLLQQQDHVAILSLGPDPPVYLPPRAHGGHLGEVVRVLEALSPQGPTLLRAAADTIAARVKRRSVIVVLSDLLDFHDDALQGFRQLRAEKHDVTLLQLLDPDELMFPFDAPLIFEDMEQPQKLACDPSAVKTGYLVALEQFLSRIRQSLRSADCEYRQVSTAESPATVLGEFLSARLQRAA